MDLAAAKWQVDRAQLITQDGMVIHTASNRRISYGELAKGQNLQQTITEDVALTPPEKWTVLGTPVPKVNGREFVTGRHQYASDIKLPGMLYGKVLRPPAFHAKLTSVDLSAAQALPGVVAVHDGDFVGVAAPTTGQAIQALGLIKAEWDSPPGPSNKDLDSLLRPHPPAPAPPAGPMTRVLTTYRVAYIAHTPLEPRAAVAEWKDGKLNVWTGTQRPFGVRSELASHFNLPEASIHVVMPDTGSGYGGKHTGEAAIEAARLAKVAGAPVKLVWTREEEFTWAYFRPAGVIDLDGAVGPDGVLTAWSHDNYNSGPSGVQSPYHVPDQHAEYHEAPGPLRPGSYRALAATANHFARESHMDVLAHAANMDPLAFRRKNITDDRLRAVLEKVAAMIGWEGRKPQAGHGFGLACGTEKGSYIAHAVELSVDPDTGAVRLRRIVAAFECGAILNPLLLQNQVEGATVMGIGGALFEEIRFDHGRILNPHLSGYRVPRFEDVPKIEVALLDRKDLPSVGAGETPIVCIAPAIANAIFEATGKRLTSMPLAPNGVTL
jgi:isoquinoline 1-oxidoreductase